MPSAASPIRLRLAACALTLCVGSGTASGAGWVIDVDAGLTYDDNIGRAERDVDRFSDERAHLGATLRRTFVLTESLGLGVDATGTGTKWGSFDDFDALHGFGALRWRFQPVRRFSAPWFELDMEGGYRRHQDSAIRDGPHGTILAAGAMRPTDILLFRAGYGFDLRRGRESEVFDTEVHRVFGHIDYSRFERFTVYVTGGWRDGEIVSTSTPALIIGAVANALAPDPAFGMVPIPSGPGYPNLPPGTIHPVPRVAYQIEASVYDVWAGFNWGIAPNASFDARAGYFESRGRGGNDYNGFSVGLNLLYRYH